MVVGLRVFLLLELWVRPWDEPQDYPEVSMCVACVSVSLSPFLAPAFTLMPAAGGQLWGRARVCGGGGGGGSAIRQ